MNYIKTLQCVTCGREYTPDQRDFLMTCPACGPVDGILDYHYDLDEVRAAWRKEPLNDRPHSHWRYRELLPIQPESVPYDWSVGWTPISETPRLAEALGVDRMFLKDDGRSMTGSFKDRASSVGVAHAMEHGANVVACSSTGNAATSLAGWAALAGLTAVIFVPESAPEPKLAQMMIYGAIVITVEGSYDDAYRLCSEACERFGWYNRNCAINPVLIEGKKTAGLEIAEQCQTTPGKLGIEWVAVSIGDGCTVAGIWKGLALMKTLGAIDRTPRIIGVQSARMSPVSYALEHDQLPAVGEENGSTGTIADSINVPIPRNWRKAVRAIRESNGVIVRVSDESILESMQTTGRLTGIYAEPAAATSVAGVQKAVEKKIIGSTDRVLALITGSGLKDTKSAIKAAGSPIRIEPTMDSLISRIRCADNKAVAQVFNL